MNDQELREAAAVMLAAADGKKIQFRGRAFANWDYVSNPTWNWGSYEYRTAPEPPPARYRPFTRDELKGLLGRVIHNMHDDNAIMLTQYAYGRVKASNFFVIDSDDLLSHWHFDDGTPCGVLLSASTGE